MSDKMKKTILLVVFGFIGGMIMNSLFMLDEITGFINGTGELTIGKLIFYFLMGGIFGAVNCGSSIVYDIERLSILGATVIHFLLVFTMFFGFGFGIWGFHIEDAAVWIFFVCMVIAYFIIWLAQYTIYKKEVRKLNEELNKISSEKDSSDKKVNE
ncbi:MAG: DUF3021 domain-containing protein [Lachnospiraceae bacterium]|nr:DUF3021 domain-containing protein [Lachnospiraceae bacterium]